MRLIYKIFGYPAEIEKTNGFSDFFTHTGSADKKRIIKQVVKKANKDQKDLVEKYEREYSKV
jgi:hypothetical protein